MTRSVKRITGTIEFTDGNTVEFGLGYEEDWRSGNYQEQLGRAVDVCESMRLGLDEDEHFHDSDDERETS